MKVGQPSRGEGAAACHELDEVLGRLPRNVKGFGEGGRSQG